MGRVAFYGKKGSFSEEGALLCFPEKGVQFVSCGKSIDEVFSKVKAGEVDAGVVPVENSNAGIVNNTYDLLLAEKAFVAGEAILPIRQHLMANKGVKFNQIKTVYSHTVANAQCSKFLKAHHWKIINYLDTASCVEKIQQEKLMNAAAIASRRSAEVYDMNILREDVQNDDKNFTRFFIITKERPKQVGNKTSIVLELRDGLNSLYEYLGMLVNRGIRIELIQSRPSGKSPFEYVIYVDFVGNPNEQRVKDAIADFVYSCGSVKYLGSYEAAKLPYQNISLE